MKIRTIQTLAAFGLGAAVLAACSSDDGVGPGSDQRYEPRGLVGGYEWVFERWSAGQAEGHPAVRLAWQLPTTYENQPFRVYARHSDGADWGLIATVTSCSAGVCTYLDRNVAADRSYDFYVATVDHDGFELATSQAIQVAVGSPDLTTPDAPRAVGLDGAAFLQWAPTGAQNYIITAETEEGDVFLIGESDGTSFLDDRAENGARYLYYIAGADEWGHVSGLSQGAVAFPRPDYHADIVVAHEDDASLSGFRFVADETFDPIVGGGSADAQWRFEVENGTARIVPLGQTRVTGGAYTTELTCGPGSDADCVDVSVAPAASDFGTSAVTAATAYTYVLQVRADGRTHYGKLRVQGVTTNADGDRVLVFDWAYQLRPDEPSLQVAAGGGVAF